MDEKKTNISDIAPDAETPKANVVAMPPQNDRPRMQEIILKMVLRGKPLSEIADILGVDISKVEYVLKTDWMEKELAKAVAEEGGENALYALMRLNAFEATMRLTTLIRTAQGNVALGACKLALEYFLAPQRNAIKNFRDSGEPVTDKEYEELAKEKERLTQKYKTA